jgi:adenosine deaminase
MASSLENFIHQMPKVEIHVHLEGSVRPATLLQLAKKHKVVLPADTVEGIQQWYTFTDFDHFVQIYIKISSCLQTPDDIELIAREFLIGQAEQNIQYSEVTYTALTHYLTKNMPFNDQLAALNRARDWGRTALGIDVGYVIDIPRSVTAEQGDIVAQWMIDTYNGGENGLVAFGLGGPEVGHPPERFQASFERIYAAGIPSVPHAGETEGPASIWGSLRALHAVRLGHGVRCLEDPELVAYLRDHQIPLEVNPSSNICLGVYPSLQDHALPRLLAEGLYITINSDDPPMFNTTLTDEYMRVSETFGFSEADMEKFVLNALQATFLPNDKKNTLESEFAHAFNRLRYELFG